MYEALYLYEYISFDGVRASLNYLAKAHRLLFLLMILMFVNPGSHNAIPGSETIHIQISGE